MSCSASSTLKGQKFMRRNPTISLSAFTAHVSSAAGGICSVLLAFCIGCGGSVTSEEQARRAYLGLDTHIDKSITLGFLGFNAASSANISPQMTKGTATGTLTISGQVDQGSSANKGMRLVEDLVGYSDDGVLTYATDAAKRPALTMSLKGIPNGTMDGTLSGTYNMTGELVGVVTLSIAFTGQLQPTVADMTKPERKPGTTHITGTAVSASGTYNVDITR
jgi:hypothetical protein